MNWATTRRFSSYEQCKPNGVRSVFVIKNRPRRPGRTIHEMQEASLAQRDVPVTLPKLKFMEDDGA